MDKTWKPNGWITIALGLCLGPVTFLYVNQLIRFCAYTSFLFTAVILDEYAILKFPEYSMFQYGLLTWLLYIACPIHAFFMSRNYEPELERKWITTWRGILSGIVIMIFFFIFMGFLMSIL